MDKSLVRDVSPDLVVKCVTLLRSHGAPSSDDVGTVGFDFDDVRLECSGNKVRVYSLGCSVLELDLSGSLGETVYSKKCSTYNPGNWEDKINDRFGAVRD